MGEINIEQIAERLDKNQDMALEVTEAARACIAERGFDVRYGARPLKRALAREILNPLSRAILEGDVREADVVRVSTHGEALNLEKDGKAPLGWVTGADYRSRDRNDVVVLKNHEAYTDDGDDLSGGE